MKPSEIVELIKKDKPNVFGELSDKKASLIVREILSHLGRHIEGMDEGVLKLTGLGKFRIRQTLKEEDGKEVPRKKVSFSMAKSAKGEAEKSDADPSDDESEED